MMDQKFIEKQKKNLLAFREEIAEDLQNMQADMTEATDADENEDREDFAAINTIRELDIAGGNVLQERLTELDQALAAIEDGTYGTCSNCGKAINPERLLAKPWAMFCIDCQEAMETAQPSSRA